MGPALFDSLGASVARAFVRIRELFQRSRIDAELEEEMRFHLDQETAHNMARGMSGAEARRAAVAAFGGVQRFREEARDTRGYAALEMLVRDLRRAVRRLWRAPVYTAGVVATLGVALGAAGGVGALVYGVMLRPLPYPEPDRLVRISLNTPGLGVGGTDQSEGVFRYLRETARSFSALGAYSVNEGVTITEGETPERATGAIITPATFSVLETVPAAGRLVTEEDALADTVSPVMISYELWRRRFGGDPQTVGRSVELNRRRRLIVGVLPKDFDFPTRDAALYYPEHIQATLADLASRNVTAIGRLAPGVSVAHAQKELDALVAHLHERFPELSAEDVRQAGVREVVQPLRAAMIEQVRSELILLVLTVAALLIIATSNVATLALLRAERLAGEVALSRALGASNGALLRRFLSEGVVVSFAGAAIAIPIVVIAVKTKLGFTDAQIPRLHEVVVTPAIVLAMLGLAALIGVLLGGVAMMRSSSGVAGALRGSVRATRGRAWHRTQDCLVGLQIALAFSLVLGAGLMMSSFARLRRIDLGFSTGGAAKFTLQLPYHGYSTYQRTAAFDLSVAEALRQTPGVTAVGIAMQFPSTPQLLYVRPRFEAARADGRIVGTLATANVVSREFFQTMGIPIRSGRSFAPGDLASRAPGVVLGGALAGELFGSENPLGREVRLVSPRRRLLYRVVGVSGDVFSDRVTEGALRVVYFPLLGDLSPASTETEERIPFMPAGVHFVVRSELPLSVLAPAFRRAVASVDPRVPIWDVRTVDDVVDATTARVRLTMLLLAGAALATLLLGVIGVYGIAAYAVEGRAAEFAVRLALGSTPRGVVRLLLVDGARVIAGGVVVGLLLSLANVRLLRGILFEVSATDPWSYVATAAVVVLAATFAVYGPARRASEQDPISALRSS